MIGSSTVSVNSTWEIVLDGGHRVTASQTVLFSLSLIHPGESWGEMDKYGKRLGLFLFLLDVYSINMIGCMNGFRDPFIQAAVVLIGQFETTLQTPEGTSPYKGKRIPKAEGVMCTIASMRLGGN